MQTLDLNKIGAQKESINSIIDFYEKYDSIQCYHACRTDDIDSYYDKGIKSYTFESLLDHIKNILDIDEENLRFVEMFAIAKEKYNNNGNRFVYFQLNRNELMNYSKHYLSKGSELVQSIAVSLEKKYFGGLVSRLSNYGESYIVTCQIPFDEIDPYFLVDLRRRIIENKISSNSDITIRVKGNVDCSNILSVERIKI